MHLAQLIEALLVGVTAGLGGVESFLLRVSTRLGAVEPPLTVVEEAGGGGVVGVGESPFGVEPHLISFAARLSAVPEQLLTVSENLFEVRKRLLPRELACRTCRSCLVAHLVLPVYVVGGHNS